MSIKSITGLAVAMTLFASPTHAKTQIEWWHAMGGALGQKVNQIASDFNASQSEYEIKPVYKGTYAETMTSAVASFRAKNQPAIVQVFEVGTASMMGAKKAVFPVYQLMEKTNEPFDPNSYLSTVTGYYTTSDGKMMSLPFNSSTPVLYYNKALFKKAGVDHPPKTWKEMETVSQKLLDSGVKCGFTTTWQSWTQIENFGARNNLPIATKNNGFDGFDTTFLFNKAPFVAHIQQMADWSKSGIFKYGGRQSDSMPLFYTQECAMVMESSAGFAGIKENMKGIDIGVSQLPYDDTLVQKPANTIIGGASLWVMSGRPDAEYDGVAKFFTYLSSPEVQADWHQATGYLPVTKAAYALTQQQGFYQKNPGADTAILQMTTSEPTANSKGLRFGNFLQTREIVDEELEKVWSGKQSAQVALDNAVKRGNEQLRRFERTQ
ncbi:MULTISPECIES: sn-glycerol-3-phosphate ABC transporter substrate-binding protein UgpB [Proteus]|jgi:sn-glycerol 3-phosphate transport system substrate-binding protein|uniref:sn-glycerol-3-phosphate-binding periplasmic protein UgpB n=1 Tax=Proteus vulgaris TaxID=585 RepID=A0A379F764_PROVU|nr:MULTISPECIES: sn-glycerol-3-phosphate ABC transporter substrate-binding protein UgpB [Proteus]NBN59476.1 sn-glycerol-3-phosphate ABC transporter substrate-binding protein UgpB [Proteus sp. G2639]RNT25931.1 sn-glycerol-3-phosphate ABC transporter substrate-binding protein UgpB [Proteus mirabilis]KGA56385.1 bacterial extracellular solute-binding family protein [Proteus vulgaris]MBG5970663.1 sn-glycerol-3-phosphate ABC transporter substrate-binding protein UgpB [Proteus vulgaris]MBG5984823.1 s